MSFFTAIKSFFARSKKDTNPDNTEKGIMDTVLASMVIGYLLIAV